MGVINVLDKHVAELIAAGEVVERPASVIKELVENAIDAGAKHITVEIKNGGTTFMRVTDDGCGIMKDDVRVAFLRHATSKVREQNDLDRISTLGFRGEALASISAVSRLQLITRSVSEDVGTSYLIEGGEEISFDDAGCPPGTTFVAVPRAPPLSSATCFTTSPPAPSSSKRTFPRETPYPTSSTKPRCLTPRSRLPISATASRR